MESDAEIPPSPLQPAGVEPAEVLGEPPISLVGLILSPRFQVLSGPLATGLLLFGYGAFRVGYYFGLPRAELLALFSLGFGVALASVAVTLGILLLVAKHTPYRRAALASIAFGALAFLLAAPLFLLTVSGVAEGAAR